MSKINRIILLVLFFTSCKTPEIITSFNTVNLNNTQSYINYKNPVIYTLPRNIIKVNVEVKHTIFKSGPYAEYAEKYVGIKDVRLADFEKYSISNIDIETFAIPDTNQMYLVENENFNKHINYLNLSPSGIIRSINTDILDDNREYDQEQLKIYEDYKNIFPFTDLSIKKNLEERKVRTYKTVFNDSNVVRVPITKMTKEKKTVEEKAEEAAALIIKNRKRRFKVIAGMYETHPDGIAIENMVKELEELETEYLSLFIGKTFEYDQTYVFYFDPQPVEELNSEILFKISESTGVVDISESKRQNIQPQEYSQNPVIINVTPITGSNALSEYLILQNNKFKEKVGFHYRKPAYVKIEIISDMKVIYSKNTLIAQYGEVMALPIDFFRDEDLEVVFYEKYGSIKYISKKK